jgi:ribosomal protein S14
MADEWYYWHDAGILGPFTASRLADLAAAGRILPTDTVWRPGDEGGVPASTVDHLFPEPPAAASTSEPATPAEPAAKPAEAVRPTWDSGSSGPTTTRRAVAGKGALIVGQDGKTVKFRMKCTTCGHEDSSYRSLTITRGTMRVSFYCPKCRHARAVEVHGHVS